MKEYLEEIKDNALFQGIKTEELSDMLDCMGCYIKCYQKDEIIILPSAEVTCVGLLISGSIHMVKENDDGSQMLLAHLKEGELFGETFACGSQRDSHVTFRAASACRTAYLQINKVLHACGNSCVFHHRMIENMMRQLCDKNIRLMEKAEVISRKTLRDKILTYLSIQSRHFGSKVFEIPLGRGEMAEYLCADRSALTRELSKMKKEGILDYEKNKFFLN